MLVIGTVVISERTDIGKQWFQGSPSATKHLITAGPPPQLAAHACWHLLPDVKVKISLCAVNISSVLTKLVLLETLHHD